MNLILTDKCTNSCPYCFAALEMQRTQRKNSLSREDFDTFMAYVERESNPIDLNVIGGEPLIYNDLDYVLSRLYASPKVRFFTLFTGGVVTPKSIESLVPYRAKMSMLFNVNEREAYRVPKHMDQVVDNLSLALRLGLRCGIGFNIYHHHFAGQQIIDLCNRFGMDSLRFSVACPIYGEAHSSFVVPPAEYETLGHEVYTFLLDCHRAGIQAVLDCPIPWCFFTDEQLGVLTRIHPEVVSRMGQCHASLDISHDLKVFRCFSLSDCTDVSLRDFDTFDAARAYFTDHIDSRLMVPKVFARCTECANKECCSGGCLSNNGLFMTHPRRIELMQDVFARIQSGEVAQAIEALHRIPNRSVSEFLLEAKLQLHLGHKDEAQVLLYRCVNNALSESTREEAIRLLQSIVEES